MRHLVERIRRAVIRRLALEWSRHPPFWLRLPARGYRQAVRLRTGLYRRSWLPARPLPCAVISIGNLVSGGTGKTPMTVCTARIAAELGYRVAVISRGHGGSAGRRGGVVSDGRRLLLAPEAAGDEPVMMAAGLAGIAMLVGHDRWRCGRLAVDRFRPQVIVLDDAFQHFALARDLDVLLLDHVRPFGNRQLLPAGPLREPISALGRAHAFVLTRTPSFAEPLPAQIRPLAGDRPVFTSRHDPYCFLAGEERGGIVARVQRQAVPPDVAALLAGGRAVAFAGIARNDDFQRTVGAMGAQVAAFLGFPDHHPYSDGDLAAIGREAQRCGAGAMVTTEKDYARLGHRAPWPLPLVVVGVSLRFDPAGPDYRAFIAAALERLVP